MEFYCHKQMKRSQLQTTTTSFYNSLVVSVQMEYLMRVGHLRFIHISLSEASHSNQAPFSSSLYFYGYERANLLFFLSKSWLPVETVIALRVSTMTSSVGSSHVVMRITSWKGINSRLKDIGHCLIVLYDPNSNVLFWFLWDNHRHLFVYFRSFQTTF